MPSRQRAPHRTERGFTLIELLVTISILAVIGALAAPNLRTFVVRNKVASMSNELVAALSQGRSLAIAKNSCVSVCVASASNSSSCAGTAAVSDYQANGWIVFRNPQCNAASTTAGTSPNVILQQRTGESNNYTMKPTNASWNIVMFDPRGYANLTASGKFEIVPPGTLDASYKRIVCLDAAGRPTVRSFSSSC
ncbi:GspH/FimT family pseudopilin [Piscinibacter terrae]|uniref:Type II secretion system protein H n=1 Tax=Piscinibacter terrae TaxID=2496871 RepID=A0A3N7HWT7_9BURK|nr:GspH/FimT family pseudopilin [Albitalea terrae]RQP26860.1 prepilin-type N-terminal cleavage/methylation domain-containing protein [Albitalea terrae]